MSNQILNEKANLLINERSPQPLQDEYNPSDYNPWGTSAFNKAKAEYKPMFLNINYVAYNWYHANH
ncbi:MAG: thioredoxin domain-containing protein [Bacillota bacterium]|nr:thioredoxin domain-containing protein [Bacillota bacterium]